MLLWIRRVFSTRSAVYVDTNWLDKDCIQPEQMLEKKRLVDKDVVSAHPILCISSGLSTAELLPGAFRPLFAGKTGSEAVFWCLAKRIQRCAVVLAAWVCLVAARFQPGKNRDHGGGLGQLPVSSAKRAKRANPNQDKRP